MKKYFITIFLLVLCGTFTSVVFAREVSKCSNLTEKNECNSSIQSDTHKSCNWDESSNKCNVSNEYNTRLERSEAPDVDSCAGFKSPRQCSEGRTANNGNFGCAWNKKYEFCSPTGLTYLSCGSGNTDAHDIPEMLPRLISYFILLLKTATPIILIIMGMVQIIKAIASSNEDEIKKAKGSLIKKIIAAVLVFFSISIVQFVVDQVVDDDESGSVAACMDCFINNNCGGVTYYTDGYGKCYNVKTKSEVKCNTDIGSKKTN